VIWELYGFVALIFFAFCYGMSKYSQHLERRLQTEHR
jgi:general L-amino acid transport system permease protein